MSAELLHSAPPRVLFGPRRPVDTGAGAPPRFSALLLVAVVAVLCQATFG
ncbi:MAG: hypothetical protein JO347_13150, partial [Candidatus Eremiobacteraeota bacterium]|nr:hypothetical protein [Candidatus Eremiobacteraeota bacterium]